MIRQKGEGPAATRQGTEQAELVRMRTEQYQMLADLARVEVVLRQHGERLLERLNAFVEADARRDAPARRAALQASREQLSARHAALRRQLARLLKVAQRDHPEADS